MLVAELVYARETEWAETLDDSCCGAASRLGQTRLGAAQPAALWLERLGVWDKARAAQELRTIDPRGAPSAPYERADAVL